MTGDSTNEAGVLIDLRSVEATDRARCGAKAATLARLRLAGFPVPDGMILPVDAFKSAVGEGADGLPAEVPNAVGASVKAGLDSLGDIALAVRSSSEAEDSEGASYAGQYQTILGARGYAEVIEAVRRCWESAFSESVVAYRERNGHVGVAAMAVLIQRMVDADASGVAFTVDPVSGDRQGVVINAVAGLADRMVGGEVDPETWRVDDASAGATGREMGVLTPERALAVAGLARSVAQYLGGPQDVEWAFECDKLWLIQARPITTRVDVEPVPVPIDVPAGSWQRDAGHFPQPHSPLGRSITYPLVNRILATQLTEAGLLVDGLELADIGGWHYVRLVPPGDKSGPAPPGWLLGLMVRLVPAMRRRASAAREFVGWGLEDIVEQWYRTWQPQLAASIGQLAAINWPALDDLGLLELWDRALEIAEEGVRTHFLMHGSVMVELYRLAVECRRQLGWDETNMFGLLGGLSSRTSEPARRLADLAVLASGDSRLKERLLAAEAPSLDDLRSDHPAFVAAVEAYRWSYGMRALSRDPADPTLADTPGLLLRLIGDQITNEFDPDDTDRRNRERRDRLLAEAKSLLASAPASARAEFERKLNHAERAYPMREDNVYFAIQAPLGLIRHVALEFGSRLASRGQIDQAEDVFFLEGAEMVEALESGRGRRLPVMRRRGERTWVLAHPGPPRYGRQEDPPSVCWLPPAMRLVHEAFYWADELDPLGVPEGSAQDGRIRGVAASSGRYTGQVVVIHDESEFHKLRPGSVVVCPVTQPTWSVLFPSIGAIVTDTGGVLAHPAIIAREYRIPAVVGTGNATGRLRDGSIVTVDGDTGTIEILK